MEKHKFIVDEVRLGKKGQITIPKQIREEDKLKENSRFKITHYPSGITILEKRKENDPDRKFLDFLEKLPYFDWRKAWEEVLEERKRERS